MSKNTAIRKIDQKYSRRTTPIGQSASYAAAASSNHAADTTIHFTEASVDHTAITNIGTAPHGTIDAHLANSAIHLTTSGTPTDGQLLIYDAASTAWVPTSLWGTPFVEPSQGNATYILKYFENVGTAHVEVFDNVEYGAWYEILVNAGPGATYGTHGFVRNDWDGGSYDDYEPFGTAGPIKLRLQDHTGGSPADQLTVYAASTALPWDVTIKLLIAHGT